MGINQGIEREEPEQRVFTMPTNTQVDDHLSGLPFTVSHDDCPWCM